MSNNLVNKKEKPNSVKIPDSVLLQILKLEHPSDCLALYVLYCSESEKQKTNQPKCTTSFTAKAFKWSERRVRKTKEILIGLGLIEDVVRRHPKTKKIVGHYIALRLISGEGESK